jgi:hypothetical protein
MKKYTALVMALILGGLLMGCSEIIEPVGTTDQSQSESVISQSSVSILDLPLTSTPSLQKISDPILITPENGGVVTITNNYTSLKGKPVSVALNLSFEPGTVSVPTTVTIKLDNRKLMAHFFPSGTDFKKPALLNANISGLDLAALPNNTTVAFYYVGDHGMEKMDVASLTWDAAAGTLQCVNGKLPHFSIYGFGFTK